MRLRSLFIASIALVLAFSCGKTPEEEKSDIKVPAESQAIFSSGISLEAGNSAQSQTVKFITSSAWITDVTDTKASSWLSVQPTSGAAGSVTLTVTAQANTGKEDRSSTVTIKAGSVTKSFTVKQAGVPIVDVTSVTLDKSELSLVEGDEVSLTATVKPDNATDKSVTWSTSNASIATVENGKVKAVKEGEATITAKAGDLEAQCLVIVKAVDEFNISTSSVCIESKGGSFEVTVSCTKGDYRITNIPSWVCERTVNNGTHIFDVEENQQMVERNGIVLFVNDKGDCLPLSVKQKGFDESSSFNWSGVFKQQSLLMDFSATWCGYSPLMDEALEIANSQRPGKAQTVRIHADGESKLFVKEARAWMGMYPHIIPLVVSDGIFGIYNQSSEEETANKIVESLDKRDAVLPVVTTAGWKSTLSGQRFSIDLSVYVKLAGTYRVTVLLRESGISEEQNFLGDGVKMYTHNQVARVFLSNALGDAFTVNTGNHIERKSYSVDIPTEYNKENMDILVYIQRAYGDGESRLNGFDFGGWYVDNCFVGKMGERQEPIVIDNPTGGSGGNEGIWPTQFAGF